MPRGAEEDADKRKIKFRLYPFDMSGGVWFKYTRYIEASVWEICFMDIFIQRFNKNIICIYFTCNTAPKEL